jgi:hypothetical protein
MSKVRTYGVVFLALLLVWLTACIRDTVLEDDLLSAHVRVQTTVKIGFQQPGTRATGTWEEGTGPDAYTEGAEEGDPQYIDDKISTMRVLAFKQGVLKANKLYSTGVTYDANQTYYGQQFGKETDVTGTTYYMDLELLPGQYRFYLIANEHPDWTGNESPASGLEGLQLETAGLGDLFNIPTMTHAVNDIQSAYFYRYLSDYFTSLNLPIPSVEPRGIPMIGVTDLNVTADPAASYNNPKEITEPISLKRTLAKLEVFLKNSSDGTTLISNDAALYRFKDVELKGFNREYNVFYGYNLNATLPDGSAGLSVPIPVHTYDTNTGVVTYHTKGAPFTEQRVFFSYLAEYNYTSEFPLNFYVHTEKIGETIEYEIPIYQKINSNKDYSIKRNHLYRVYCTLEGSGIIQVKYAVGDWTLKDLETVLGYGFQLVRDGNTITITNTMQACAPHEIKLIASGGASIDTNVNATVIFGGNELTPGNNDFNNNATKSYAIAINGGSIEVKYNGITIKTFTE